MPFPPVFTNIWDITFPPDTQLANLLGQDLRQLRVDVMQRMSLLSGTLGNRPTPEILNATWGGAGFGLTYYATDTNQLFQWNGGAWVQLVAGLPTIGGVFIGPVAAQTIVIWQAPFACTVTNVKGFRSGGTGATVNAQKNGALNHLAADLSLVANNTWTDGGAVQNTAYAIGDYLSLMLTGETGSPSQVNVQVNFTR
jgi:hypothetical protein